MSGTGTRNSVEVSTADTYFSERYAAEDWKALTDTDKVAALATAELLLSQHFALDFTRANHEYAVCEQALFVAQHMHGMDARWGLYQQGVKQSTVVGETYRDFPNGMPICMLAQTLLDSVRLDTSVRLATIDRDDTEIL